MSFRSLTVLNVLFKYASALSVARLVSTAFARASLCVKCRLSHYGHVPMATAHIAGLLKWVWLF